MDWVLLAMFIATVGSAIGYYLQAWISAVITAVMLLYGVACFREFRQTEIIGDWPFLYLVYGGLGIIAMWTGYYIGSGQTFLGDVLRLYILR